LLSQLGEQKKDSRGGHNKEIIMLNIKTFKLFCIKIPTLICVKGISIIQLQIIL